LQIERSCRPPDGAQADLENNLAGAKGNRRPSSSQRSKTPAIEADFAFSRNAVFLDRRLGRVSSGYSGQALHIECRQPRPCEDPRKPPFGDARFGTPEIQLTAHNVHYEKPLRQLSASDGSQSGKNDNCRRAPNRAAAFDSRRIPLTC
jgi:hypothetical protein